MVRNHPRLAAETLRTQDKDLQEYITTTLGKMDIKVVPLLVQTLEKGEESQSKKIVKTLHKLGPEGILEILRIKNKID